jgi:hypothetical protein
MGMDRCKYATTSPDYLAYPAGVADCPFHVWEERVEEIRATASLRDCWDGENAQAPQKEDVEAAVEFAEVLRKIGAPPPDCIVPSLDGAIIFTWQPVRDGKVTVATIEVCSQGALDFFVSKPYPVPQKTTAS